MRYPVAKHNELVKRLVLQGLTVKEAKAAIINGINYFRGWPQSPPVFYVLLGEFLGRR